MTVCEKKITCISAHVSSRNTATGTYAMPFVFHDVNGISGGELIFVRLLASNATDAIEQAQKLPYSRWQKRQS